MTHTSGPWSIIFIEDWTANHCEPSSICHVGDYVIGTNYSSYDFHGTDEDDARLISAAPDLLAAAQLYYATYCSTQKNPTPMQEADCMRVMRAAIAKAIGDAS